MSNYKIRVNNEAESKEAQELFFEFGASTDSCDRFGIVCLSEGKVYTDRVEFFKDYDDCEEITLPQLRDLVAQSKNEQGLISGADALRALADGEEVEFKTRVSNWNLINKNDAYAFSLFLDDDSSFSFRIKPCTITLNVEIPAPFEPKDGDEVWFLDSTSGCGYSREVFGVGFKLKWIQFGAWKNEEEIKQVVAALRGALK